MSALIKCSRQVGLALILSSLFIETATQANPITGWDFEDGTLQGWTNVSVSTMENGPTHYEALSRTQPPSSNGTAFWDPLGYNSQPTPNGYAAAVVPFDAPFRSNPQDAPLVLRSPTFQLQSGQIIAHLLGGIPGDLALANPPSNYNQLSGPSINRTGSNNSYQGIALRRDSDGEYLSHKFRTGTSSSYNGWQQVTFTESELQAISDANPGALFTLDLIDTAHAISGATFGNINLDTITIPASVGSSLVQGGGQWDILKRDTTAAFFPNPGTTLATADTLLGLPSNDPLVVGDFLGNASVINMHGSGATGHFGDDEAYPGGAADRFALHVTGRINVLQAGDITFGFYSNDGARLMIDGTVVAQDNFVGDVAADVFGTINLSAGLHDVDFVMFETSGSDTVELYVATSLGTYTSFNGASFELLRAVPEPAGLMLAALAVVLVTGAFKMSPIRDK